ncbi:collagen alpha-6(VI) chain-like [Biomphalaria glabrata]|uniref:Collagen alpha-6(VI) chain-like n=1 Tax=Biomphalaria glabrata TaxID=6526 RepID=A0A9W2YB62_BIOGL|nr:collagen alpha-6(VI) chain-like [Biomphalaria glabrata]XP_055859958.1 collagen alpha-6(VI) chain-like [Biomphalaria glabrata]XP_055859959.1 collagen alpha-6(VI) chain-like [Biomphalaria glabrata]
MHWSLSSVVGLYFVLYSPSIYALDYVAEKTVAYEEYPDYAAPTYEGGEIPVYDVANNPQYVDYGNVKPDYNGLDYANKEPDYTPIKDPVYGDYVYEGYEYYEDSTTPKPTTKAPTTTTKATTTTKTTTTTTTATTSRTTTQVPCTKKSKADIFFTLDSSSSIGPENWKLQRQFAAETTQAFTIGSNDVQFGTLIFNSEVFKIHDLNTFSSKSALYNAISNITYSNLSGTYTYRALRKIREDKLFSAQYGGRMTSRIVIVMTDGESTDKVKTKDEAALLKKEGVTILAVGIGNEINITELRDIASDPAKNVFIAGSYQMLNLIKNDLLTITCEKA